MGARGSLDGRQILVVEDDLMIALDICEVLEDLGCVPVGPASTVAAGLELVGMEGLDAALLDENLGTVLVTPVAEALARRGVPFAVVSGHQRSLSINPLLTRAIRLPKPARSARIAETLSTLLRPS